MGIGAILVVVAAVAAALTLLPAVLRLLGDRVNAVAYPPSAAQAPRRRAGFWDRTDAAGDGAPAGSASSASSAPADRCPCPT